MSSYLLFQLRTCKSQYFLGEYIHPMNTGLYITLNYVCLFRNLPINTTPLCIKRLFKTTPSIPAQYISEIVNFFTGVSQIFSIVEGCAT